MDWSRFEKGGLSETFWREFKDLVLLAHAHAHWTEELREARRMKSKEKNGGWEKSEQSAYTHQGRTLFLAGEKIGALPGHAQTELDKQVLADTIKRSGITPGPRGHERIRLDFLALHEFSPPEKT